MSFRQFFLTIPEPVSEAARVDATSELFIYAKIIMPLRRPAINAAAVLSPVQAWTDYVGHIVELTQVIEHDRRAGSDYETTVAKHVFTDVVGRSSWKARRRPCLSCRAD